MIERVGFVPPAARRKIAQREMIHHKERRKNLVMAAALLAFFCLFIGFNVSYWHSMRKYHNNIHQVGYVSVGANDNDNADSDNNSKLSNLRGGHGVWIDQNSQPFVS
jgi:hypothetical protein